MVLGTRAERSRDLKLDNVKGLLIVLVVAGHFLLPMYRTRFITDCIYAIYVFHMPCFIMLSGYYAKSVYKNDHFRVIKLIELIWMYFVFKMLVNITEGMLGGHIPLFPDFLHESGAPWYLLALFFWYATIPLIHNIKRPLIKVLFLIAVTLGISFGKYFINCNDFLSLDRALSFAPFFYLGYFCSEHEYKAAVKSKGGMLMAVIGFILLAIVFFTTYDLLFRYHLVVYGADYSRYDVSQKNYIWGINLVWYIVAFLISFAVIFAAPSKKLPLITTMGQNTLQIYILHRPIRDLWQYYNVYGYIDPHNKAEVMIVIVFSAALAALIGNSLFGKIFNIIKKIPDILIRKSGITI